MNIINILYAVAPTIMSNENEGKTKTQFGIGHRTLDNDQQKIKLCPMKVASQPTHLCGVK